MQKLASVRRNRVPLFVTLTYHRNVTDVATYKADLHKFFVYAVRRWPRFAAIWKLEFQGRGAAHFHLFVWGVGWSKRERDALVSLWCKIANKGDRLALALHKGQLGGDNRHGAEILKDFKGALAYAAKYMGKTLKERVPGVDVTLLPGCERPGMSDMSIGELVAAEGSGKEALLPTGRFWGVVGRAHVPFSPMLEFRLDWDAALDYRQMMVAKGLELRGLSYWLTRYDVHMLDYLLFLLDWYGPPAPEPIWELILSEEIGTYVTIGI